MKKLFEKIKLALLSAFGKLLDFLVKHGRAAVKVTDIVKGVIDNPALDLIVAITPTKKDDEILARAKSLVPKIAVKIGVAMNIVSIAEAESDQVIALSKVLEYVSNQLPEEGRAIFYRELSGAIAEALSDGNISGGEAIAITQLVFSKVL